MFYWKRLLFFVSVEGESGWPRLVAGKQYFASVLKRPRVGDYIVFEHPQEKKVQLVKKIVEENNTQFVVAGNLPWASGSRDFGPVQKQNVWGTVLK